MKRRRLSPPELSDEVGAVGKVWLHAPPVRTDKRFIPPAAVEVCSSIIVFVLLLLQMLSLMLVQQIQLSAATVLSDVGEQRCAVSNA